MASGGKHRTQPDPSAARVGARIRQLRHDAGYSFDAFVEEVGLGRGYVSELERGLVVPSLTTLERVASALDLSPADLVTGSSPREQLFELTRHLSARDVNSLLAEAAGRARVSPSLPFRVVDRETARTQPNATPLLKLRPAAGGWSAAQSMDTEAWVIVPLRARSRRGLFIARIDGDSMQPTIANGAYALFQRPWAIARPGEVGIFVRWESDNVGRFTVKEYRGRAHRGSITGSLRPHNPARSALAHREGADSREQPFARFVRTLAP